MLKISIILIVYNRSDLLRKSLLSINAQSHLPDEVIITDDGSDEDILSILRELSNSVKYRLKYVRQENKGFRAAKARNNGVRLAENDYLVFYDQDIIGTGNYLRTFVDYADESKFIVSYPIRLSNEQSDLVDDKIIKSSNYFPILKFVQTLKIKKQYFKDYFEYTKKNIGVSKRGPKLRSGVFAVHKSNYLKVNGFDEKFIGWGNEDDDLGKRLYKSGISGFNPFYNEFPLHLYHKPFHESGKRKNKEYVSQKNNNISEDNFYCEHGINSEQNENIEIVLL
jgi:GT2 family glycosyltransferase